MVSTPERRPIVVYHDEPEAEPVPACAKTWADAVRGGAPTTRIVAKDDAGGGKTRATAAERSAERPDSDARPTPIRGPFASERG